MSQCFSEECKKMKNVITFDKIKFAHIMGLLRIVQHLQLKVIRNIIWVTYSTYHFMSIYHRKVRAG